MEECEGGKDWLGIKFLPVSHEITLHRSLAPVETWAEKTLQRRRGILEGGVEMGIRRSQFRGGRCEQYRRLARRVGGRKGVRANGISLEKGKPTVSPSKGPQRAPTNYMPLSKDEHQPFPRHPAVMPGLFNFVGCWCNLKATTWKSVLLPTTRQLSQILLFP